MLKSGIKIMTVGIDIESISNQLPKRAVAVLEKTDRLINFYLSNGNDTRSIVLYRKDFMTLHEALKDRGFEVNDYIYRGFTLLKDKAP